MTSIHTPSPKSPETEKNRRYDRQLRLWGENGQQALETSHVCLINATSLGTEILKSLVLPGIRAFTIIDDQKITEDDIDSNFFLFSEENSLGQSRAKVAATCLLEMNDDVKKGDYVEDSLETILDKDIKYFQSFSLVIACSIKDERLINKLSQTLWSLNVPLILVKSVGFFGYIRLQIKEHAVIEPHPDNRLEDLRLEGLFPELKSYLDSYPSFNKLSRRDLSHVPALVIIYKSLLKWREIYHKNENEIPLGYKEKSVISSIIKEEMFNLKSKLESSSKNFKQSENDSQTYEEDNIELENFEEACKLINKVFYDSKQVFTNLNFLLNEAKSIECFKKTSNQTFWILMKALDEFIAKYGCLPLSGTIPDMNSSSNQYVHLQKIYKEKAKDDVKKVFKIAQNIQKTFPSSCLMEKDVEIFCKNVLYLRVIRTSSIFEELTGKRLRDLAICRLQNDTDEEGSDSDELRIYIILKLIDRFYSKYKKFPGETEDEVIDVDIAQLKREFRDFHNDLGCNIVIKDDYIHEICRYGGCELHTISALIGGCAAQEAIKIITGQYIPIDNVFVYNGIHNSSATYKL